MLGLLVALSIFAFVGGSYFSEAISSKSQNEIQSEVKSANSEVKIQTEEDEESEAKVEVKVESESTDNQKKEQANPSPAPGINEFKYPSSGVISSDSNKLVLESPDAPDKITDWYKEKIKSKNLSATSFVTTSANEKVLNKLAADGAFHIEVEIQKDGDSNTQITVSVTN